MSGCIPVPACKVVGCEAVLGPWGHYNRGARGADGIRLAELPIARFMCPIPGHGTVSCLPPFLCRYLHYVAPVIEEAVVEISVEGKEVEDVVMLDGPSTETLQRWNLELTSLPVREWVLKRLPGKWPAFPGEGVRWPERFLTWEAARCLTVQARIRGLQFFSALLQRARLALMKRYAADWLLIRG